MVVEFVQFYFDNHYHQKMRRNFVYCNCLIRYYRSRLYIFGSSNVFCPHCKRSFCLLVEKVCEHQTFSVFIYASHLKALILFAFALTYTVA